MPVQRTVEFDDRVEAARESFADTRCGELDHDTAPKMFVLDGLPFPPEDRDDPRRREVYDFLDDRTVGPPPDTTGDHRADAGDR